jgi:hypothetical protein
MPLIHYRDELVDFANDTNPEPAIGTANSRATVPRHPLQRKHVQVLLTFLSPWYDKFMDETRERLNRKNPMVRFSDLLFVFKPGIDVYYRMNGVTAAGVVVGSKYIAASYSVPRRWILEVWYLAFNGRTARRCTTILEIRSYENEQPMINLAACPASVWDKADTNRRRNKLQDRAKRVFELCKDNLRQISYNGLVDYGRKVG